MRKNKTTIQHFSLLASITVFEKIIAFVFEAVIAAYIGVNMITDGYFTAAELFTLVDSAFVSAIVVAAMKRFSIHALTEGEDRGFSALSEMQSFYFPFILFLSFIIFLCAVPLSYVVAPGYETDARQVVVRCIRVMSVVPSIVCLTTFGTAVLRQKKKFAITALKSLFISVVGIFSVVVFGRKELQNADVLSVAFVISVGLYSALVRISAHRYGSIRFLRPRLTQDVKDTLRMMLPLMVSYGVGRIALMVDKIIASTLATGSVSGLTYAHSLYKVVCAIFVTNLNTIILTDFNNLNAKKHYDKMVESIRRTISRMTLLLLPITLVSLFCSNDIVKIVYERGKFSAEATSLVADVLVFYVINFIPVMIQGVYIQAMYSFGDTLRPMLISACSILINLGFSIPLTLTIGLPGVAIGTCISTIFAVMFYRKVIRKKLPDYHGCYTPAFLLKCLAASVVSAGALWGIRMFHLPALPHFIVSTVVGFGLLIAFLLLLREENMLLVLQSLRDFIDKKKKDT